MNSISIKELKEVERIVKAMRTSLKGRYEEELEEVEHLAKVMQSNIKNYGYEYKYWYFYFSIFKFSIFDDLKSDLRHF